MNIKYSAMVIILSLAALEGAAQTVDTLLAQMPTVSTNFTDYEKQLSVINIPVTIDLRDIEKKINEEYKDLIYSDLSFDNNNQDDLKIKVKKRAKILVGTVNNQVKVIIPLNIWAEKQVRQTILGKTLKQSAATTFDVTIDYFIDLKIKKDWTLESTTKGTFRWDKKPFISVGGLVDIPLESQIEAPLKQQVDDIAKEIDKAIKEAIDLKAIGKEAWSVAQTPILMDEATSAWLYINPQSISVTPLELKNNRAVFNLGITTYVNNKLGGSKMEVKPTPLPQLKIVESIPDDFKVVLSAFVQYDDIKQLLGEQLVGETFEYEDQSITITDADFIGSAEKIVVKVAVDAHLRKGIVKKRVRGALFLEGVPFYDEVEQAVKIRDLEYSLETRDVLLKTAKWLSDGKIKTMLNEKMVFPVGTQIQTAKQMIEKELTSYTVNEYATISGMLKELRPQGIYLTPKALQVVILADGKVSMKVGGF
jgi:hypothetical protein